MPQPIICTMQYIQVKPAESEDESRELDNLLWEVLWKPIGLPRDFRESVTPDRECLEFVVKQGGELLGGLVANRVSQTTVELQHLALLPKAQGKVIGRKLLQHFLKEMKNEGCTVVETIARNTSASFFEKMGFVAVPGANPSHPSFLQHDITFVRMEYRCNGG